MNPRIVLIAFVCFGMAGVSYGQLFPNAPWNRSTSRTVVRSSSSCPGGVCPTSQPAYQPARTVVSSGHWTYPGPSIAHHLADAEHAAQLRAKGISTRGMSQEQMLSLHDALHENRVVVPNRVKTITPSPSVKLLPPVQQVVIPPSRPAAAASESTFGLSYVETVIPKHVLAQVAEVEDSRVEVADTFRGALAKAIRDARKSDKITARDAVRLRVAMLSPAFVERAHELAVSQVAFSGEESEFVPLDENGVVQTEGINWEGLAKFLEVFVPLLITLLKAFGL